MGVLLVRCGGQRNLGRQKRAEPQRLVWTGWQHPEQQARYNG